MMANETQFFRKIYLPLYSKGLRKGYCVRGELETEQRLHHIDPHSSGYSSISFLFSWTSQPVLLDFTTGGLVLTPRTGTLTSNSDLQLPVAPGYITIRRPPTSYEHHICTQFNPLTVKVIPRYLWLDAPVIYTGAFLIWQLGWVRGQYVTM